MNSELSWMAVIKTSDLRFFFAYETVSNEFRWVGDKIYIARNAPEIIDTCFVETHVDTSSMWKHVSLCLCYYPLQAHPDETFSCGVIVRIVSHERYRSLRLPKMVSNS